MDIALNKTVTAYANGGSTISGTISDIVNGTPNPDGTPWSTSTNAWWTGTAPYLTITLGANYSIQAFTVQADDNDTYEVDYWNRATSSWTLAYAVPEQYTTQGGLQTRPTYTLSTPIVTDQLKVFATTGDGSYAIGQVYAMGTLAATPEPACTLLLASVAALATCAERRNRRRTGRG